MPAASSQLQLNFAERAVRRRPTSLVLGVMLSVVAFIVAFVGNVVVVDRLGGDIVALAAQAQHVTDDNAQLRTDIAHLQSADRITSAAAAMGLALPGSPAIPLHTPSADEAE